MLAACPRCRARYRLDPNRIQGGTARVRCRRCETVFRVSAHSPQAHGALIAMLDGRRAKQVSQLLALPQGEVVLACDGCEAVLAAVRHPPAVVIVDEELDGLDGFEVCEILKRTRGLESLRVVVVASGPATRHSLEPSMAPDAVVAGDALDQKLAQVLHTLGFAVSEPPYAPREPHPSPQQPEALSEEGLLDEERANAARLARIVVADIVLYDPDRFDEAARADCLTERFATELREGRALFERRIDERVRSERDYLDEELERVASQRCDRGVERD